MGRQRLLIGRFRRYRSKEQRMLGYVLLLIVLIAGYPVYLSIRDRQLAKRIDKYNDPDLIMAEMDIEIQKTKEEAEFFKRNSSR
jgi:hypothetical protein